MVQANLKYTKDHEWIRIEDDIAVVGITDFAQGELGDIVYVEIETIDQNVIMGDVFGTVETLPGELRLVFKQKFIKKSWKIAII